MAAAAADRDWLQSHRALSYGLREYQRSLEVLHQAGWSARRCIPHARRPPDVVEHRRRPSARAATRAIPTLLQLPMAASRRRARRGWLPHHHAGPAGHRLRGQKRPDRGMRRSWRNSFLQQLRVRPTGRLPRRVDFTPAAWRRRGGLGSRSSWFRSSWPPEAGRAGDAAGLGAGAGLASLATGGRAGRASGLGATTGSGLPGAGLASVDGGVVDGSAAPPPASAPPCVQVRPSDAGGAGAGWPGLHDRRLWRRLGRASALGRRWGRRRWPGCTTAGLALPAGLASTPVGSAPDDRAAPPRRLSRRLRGLGLGCRRRRRRTAGQHHRRLGRRPGGRGRRTTRLHDGRLRLVVAGGVVAPDGEVTTAGLVSVAGGVGAGRPGCTTAGLVFIDGGEVGAGRPGRTTAGCVSVTGGVGAGRPGWHDRWLGLGPDGGVGAGVPGRTTAKFRLVAVASVPDGPAAPPPDWTGLAGRSHRCALGLRLHHRARSGRTGRRRRARGGRRQLQLARHRGGNTRRRRGRPHRHLGDRARRRKLLRRHRTHRLRHRLRRGHRGGGHHRRRAAIGVVVDRRVADRWS